MSEVNDRIKELRTTLKLSQRAFAKQIFIGQSSLGEIELGKRQINDRVIQLICSQFNVNWDWLKFGKGEMFDTSKPDLDIKHLIEIYKQLERPLQEYFLQQMEGLLKLHNENNITKKL